MNTPFNDSIYQSALSDKEFNRLSDFIQTNYGIKMPPSKKVVLQGRLHKRLKKLGLADYASYVDYVFSKEGQGEIIHMMDVVSTNKTDYFREPIHFEFLEEVLLPQIKQERGNQKIKIWSAGCSSGEEPYTIGIVMQEFKEQNPGFDYSILGTDISTQMLQQGADGIYKSDRIDIIPTNLKKKYFLKSKDKSNPRVRVVKTLRDRVDFSRLNFMDNYYDVKQTFDIIFCRNALIYFERENQEIIINKLCQSLKPGGYFFLGHSESITNMDVPLQSVKPTIFRKI